MNYNIGQDRHQMMMISLDQFVAVESFTRIIDAFVDALDLSSFEFDYSQLKNEGRPPYLPAMMLKLYLYGYHYNIRSCRKLEHAAQVNMEVMWLLKGLRPHYKTIANFRKNNSKSLKQVFRHFIMILKDWNLVSGKHITVDSFKVRAQNSLKNNFNQRKLDRHLEYIDQKIKEYTDALEREEDGIKRDEIHSKIEHQIKKWNAYCEVEEVLIKSEEEQISTTDSDARAVVLHRNIVNVGYNIQAVSDSKHKLLIAIDTGTVNDTHSLSGMVARAKSNLNKKPMDVLADKGYHTGSELEKCELLKVKTYVSPKENSANKKFNVFPVQAFKYHHGTDTFRCPANQILRTTGTFFERKSRRKGGPTIRFKHYTTKACKHCLIKSECTTSERGRLIQRQENQGSIDRNNKRVLENPEYYRNRQQWIEHQFGTLKRHWGFTYVLTRGKEKVLGEVSLLFTAYNLRRSMSILGFAALMHKTKMLKTHFYTYIVHRSHMELHSFINLREIMLCCNRIERRTAFFNMKIMG